MPKETRKLVPVQRLVGLQVIDTKGSLIGNVKDVSLDFENKDISLSVSTKSKGDMGFSWDDVQSVEDVVLLKKEVEMPSTLPESKQDLAVEQHGQTMVICSSCGASSPARAKFCSKCGTDLKS